MSKRKVTEFKVKWSGFPDEASTWEPETNIPKFIQVFYKECKSRLGNLVQLGGKPFVSTSLFVSQSLKLPAFWDLPKMFPLTLIF